MKNKIFDIEYLLSLIKRRAQSKITDTRWFLELAVLIVIVVCIPVVYTTAFSSYLELDLDITVSDDLSGQLFYSDTGVYSEEDSVFFQLLPGKNKYTFEIFADEIKYIRLDPGNGENSTFSIEFVKLSSSSDSRLLANQELTDATKLLNSVVASGSKKSGYTVVGMDPYLQIHIDGPPIISVVEWVISPFIFALFLYLLIRISWFYRQCITNRVTHNQIEISVLFLIFCCCLVISVLSPPFQSPDEFVHTERAVHISNGNLALETDGRLTGVRIDKGILEYMNFFQGLPRQADGKITSTIQGESIEVVWMGESVFVQHSATAPYFSAIYLPQAIAYRIAQDFNLSVANSYKLSRNFVLTLSFLVLLVATMIVRIPLFSLAILATPMMMFQFVSTSIDGFSVALAVLALSCYTKIVLESYQTPSRSVVGLVCTLLITLLVVLTSRPYMLPMLLLLFHVAYLRKSWVYLTVSIAGLLSVCFWVVFATSQVVDARVDVGESKFKIVTYYLSHPSVAFDLAWHTIESKWLFYRNSFIGVLGWLDTNFRGGFYSISSCLILLILFTSISYRSLKNYPLARLSLVFGGLSSIILIFVALLLNWSEHPAKIISGVQGRYFTIPILMIGATISFRVMPARTKRFIVPLSLLLVWIVYAATSTIRLLLERYWLH